MKMNNRAIAALMGLGMLAAPALAQAESLKDKLDNIQISGFVDTSIFSSNLNNANGTTNRGIGLDQIELDIEYNEGNVGMRFDLNAFPSDSAAGGANGGAGAGVLTGDGLIEQGYITYTIPSIADEGLTFTLGKFNAPIGWELLDAPDMYQFSHALVFNFGIPTNLTGAMISASVGVADLSVYLTNGTDVNGTQQDGMKTYGGRLGLSPIDGLNIGFSYLVDKNRNNQPIPTAPNNPGNLGNQGNPSSRIFDIDFTYDGIENLIIGAEYNDNKGFQNDTTKLFAGNQISSRGYMVMAHYDFTDMIGATVRYDYFDFDRAVTGSSKAYTAALTASLGGGLGALIEVRQDKNSALAIDANNTPSNKSVNTYALEMTYGF